MKAPVTDYLAKRTLLKITGAKWKSLFLARGNRLSLLFNEERLQFKKFVLSSLTFDVPQKSLVGKYKAKIICDDGSIVYLWFSEYAWCFSENGKNVGKIYKTKHLSPQYGRKLACITFCRQLLDKPPQLPSKMPKCAKENLTLFFKDINSSSSINMKRLAGYFQMLHDYNTLAQSPYKNIISAKENSEYLLKKTHAK